MNNTRQLNSWSFSGGISWTAAVAHAADNQTATKEKELIEKLRSDSPAAEKAIACKQLAVYGSPEAVPELERLLTDEHLASSSRIALEAIPGPEASEALRKAMDRVKDELLVGTINSIGVRRDASRRRSLDRPTARCRRRRRFGRGSCLGPHRKCRRHQNIRGIVGQCSRQGSHRRLPRAVSSAPNAL